MAAIITDQLRILNAKNFVSLATSDKNSYYSFVGLPNATSISSSWDTNPPAPKDSFDQETSCWDTMIALKKIVPDDVRQVVRKISWDSGTTYDMYRHDITRDNPSKPSQALSIYSANYYVVNKDFRVYVCLQNGTDPENSNGRPSLDEPTFTDLEPRSAGTSGDGYVWKYIYTIAPSDIVKFDTINFIPVPKNWDIETSTDACGNNVASVRENAATSGQLKICTIKNRGSGIGTANRTYTNVPISGDGAGAECTITVDNDSKIGTINISKGGSGYSFGTVNLVAGGVPVGITDPIFDVIIPPQGGHGADVYRELGAFRVLVYSRIENDNEDPDFIVGNQIARVGLVENPKAYGTSTNLTKSKASAVGAIKLVGAGYSTATFAADSLITQTIGTGQTAVAKIVSYDQTTGVLKYWQDRTLAGFSTNTTNVLEVIKNTSPNFGFELKRFTATPSSGGSVNIVGGTATLGIDTAFSASTATINSRTYNLGQQFTSGLANPEVQKYTGNILYVDHRPSITRSQNQREDIKIVLQF
jgi:hypothetical protein